MTATQTVTHRVDLTIEVEGSLSVRKDTKMTSHQFECPEGMAPGEALRLAMAYSESFACGGETVGRLLAVHVIPLRLTCKMDDGTVDRRGWLYDRKLIWSVAIGRTIEQEASRFKASA